MMVVGGAAFPNLSLDIILGRGANIWITMIAPEARQAIESEREMVMIEREVCDRGMDGGRSIF
jgi:hypothetical protein